MESKANLLVTEIFDTELIGEGVIPTIKHALENLLEVIHLVLIFLIIKIVNKFSPSP